MGSPEQWTQLQVHCCPTSSPHCITHSSYPSMLPRSYPPIVFRSHSIPLLNSNMVSLWVTRQRSVADNISNAKSPSCTTNFATAPGRLDIAFHIHVAAAAATGTSFSESMVPPAYNTILDPTAVTPAGGVFITSSGTINFATQSDCLDIARRTTATALTYNRSYMASLPSE